MEEPRSRVIRNKPNGHVIRGAVAQGDDIAPDRICEIRHIATCNPDNIEGVLAKALTRDKEMWTGIRTPCKCIGC